MPELEACLHVCCGEPAAGSTKVALRELTGIRGLPVICSNMLENAGPLDFLDKPQERLSWFHGAGFDIHKYKGFSEQGPQAMVDQWQVFWTRIEEWTGPVMVWFSSRNASDRSLLLALVSRLGATCPIYLIDVAKPAIDGPGASDVGELSPELLKRWIPMAEQLAEARLHVSGAEYDALVAAPNALRMFADGQLSGAPLDGLDGRILSGITAEWTSLSRCAAGIPGAFGNGGYRDLDFTWLLWRIEELQRTGRIERRDGRFDPEFRGNPLEGDVRLCG